MNCYQYYCIVVTVVTIAVCSAAIDNQFAEFKLKYGKKYSDSREEMRRKSLFIQATEYIHKHNSNPKRSYSLQINKFSDMDPAEFSQTRKGNRPSPLSLRHGLKDHVKTYKPTTTLDVLPAMVDWREKGVVTRVKDQGQCGSCWAFSTTGTLEGQHAIATGELVTLSEQQLVDCSHSYLNDGCNGGLVSVALTDIKEMGGIDTEGAYPYEGGQEYCRFDTSTVGATCTGYRLIQSGNCDDLKVAVATVGPISVSMDANQTSFMYYSEGVYQPEVCSTTQLDHALLAVGYGTEDGVDYWLIKNSWGSDWGMAGYFKIAAADNTCGICTDAVYPLV